VAPKKEVFVPPPITTNNTTEKKGKWGAEKK